MASADPGALKATAAAPADGGEDTGLKFSQCMRDQGFTWFPDPGTDGGLKVSVPEGTDQSAFDKAQETCQQYAPGRSRGGPISDEDLDKIRQMSQCIRDHGFSKYPDPDANGGIELDDSTGISPEDPAFATARQECQKYLPPRQSRGNS